MPERESEEEGADFSQNRNISLRTKADAHALAISCSPCSSRTTPKRATHTPLPAARLALSRSVEGSLFAHVGRHLEEARYNTHYRGTEREHSTRSNRLRLRWRRSLRRSAGRRRKRSAPDGAARRQGPRGPAQTRSRLPLRRAAPSARPRSVTCRGANRGAGSGRL